MPKKYVVIHHSATADSGTVSWGAIRKYHMETNGWHDIGYHFGVERVGDDFYALLGRAEGANAAAVKESNANTDGIHVCCVGDYDASPPEEAMLKVLVDRVLVPVMQRHYIPSAEIYTHNHFAPYKTCPGTMFPMETVRKMVKEKLG